MKCDHEPCGNRATCDVQWRGSGDIQTATLCQQHSAELWERIGPLLQANQASYRIDEPLAIKFESAMHLISQLKAMLEKVVREEVLLQASTIKAIKQVIGGKA